MWKKATIGGLAAVAVLAGTAGATIAHASGSNAPSAASASSTPTGGATTATPGTKGAKDPAAKKDKSAKKAGGEKLLGNLKDLQHAEWVTKGANDAYVTHEAIFGQVKAVSATSITVASADGTSMTFAVTDKTAVHQRRAKAKGTPTTKAPSVTIADVKTGQTVLVGGEKSPDLTAKNVLVRAG